MLEARRKHSTNARTSAVVFALLAAGSVMSGAPRAEADDKPPKTATPPLSQALSGEAKAAYDEGRLLVDDKDYAGAFAKFKRAHELSSEPRLLWNMAVCEKELRHYANAGALVSRYLAEGGSLLGAESRANAEATLHALQNLYSPLSLKGVPPQTKVLLDGVAVAESPLAADLLVDVGTHELELSNPGYEPYRRKFDVPGMTPVELSVELTPVATTARLALSARPDSAALSVDGRVVGYGRWEGVLGAGQHGVRVSAAGYATYQADVDLAVNKRRTIDVDLVAERHAAIWPWIVGGAVVAAGAAVGGYFLFRSEPAAGASPSGQLGAVQLPVQAWPR